MRRQVSSAGFDSACAVANAFSSAHDQCLALSRLMVTSDTGEDEVVAWMNGSGAPERPHHRALAFGWRQYRRLQALRPDRGSVGGKDRAPSKHGGESWPA